MSKPLWKSLTLPLVVAGCYQYEPVDHAGVPATTSVSVELSARGTTNVANKIGQNVVAVEGTVTEAAHRRSLALSAVRGAAARNLGVHVERRVHHARLGRDQRGEAPCVVTRPHCGRVGCRRRGVGRHRGGNREGNGAGERNGRRQAYAKPVR